MKENNTSKKFYNVGLSYKKADVHTRGKFSISKENQILLLQDAKSQGIDGVFVLSTCNRTEITGFAEHPFQLIKLLCHYSQGTVDEFVKVSNVNKDKDAIHHIFNLATGLSSQILGDYEIVGQLKQSFKMAKEQKVVNAYLERLINLVLQASKRVKNRTKLSSGTTSVSYAAVQYILKNLPNQDSKNILVYGLGKMGKYTCKNLAEYTQNKNVCLINRTDSKAISFVEEHSEIRFAAFENLAEEIDKTDILIVSTGAPEPTVTEVHVKKGKKLLVLDLSMPKNVSCELKDRKEITLVDVDQLSLITDKTLEVREKRNSEGKINYRYLYG